MSDRPLVGIGVLVVKDGKVLLGKRKNAHGAGEYASPGGHLEYLETIAACAAREVREETGLEIGPVRFLRVLEVMRYAPKHYVDIAVVADWVSGEPQTLEPDKIEGWAWYDRDALPSPLFDTLPSALAALAAIHRRPSGELAIFFASALHGVGSFGRRAARIDALSALGHVLTEHALLERAHVVIADVTAPSTGTGFLIARAIARGIPVLCLHERGQPISAMIAASPDVRVADYADEPELLRRVRAFLLDHVAELGPTRCPRIFLAGSGRGTLGARLAELTGAPYISTTPADRLVARLAADDCRLFGFILDGHPSSLAELADLRAAGIVPDVVFYLDGDAGFDELATRWYPDRLVVRVDAERDPDQLVLATLRDRFAGARHTRAYFAVPSAAPPRSTRLHFHVDARDVHEIRAIAHEIHVRHKAAQGQVKIHPIDALALGPQHAALPIYSQLPSFHGIPSENAEAFITGRLGDGDRALMEVALEVGRAHHAMVELEEYVGEWTLRADGAIVVDAEYPLTDPAAHAYPQADDARLAHLPRWELHHGFDVPKADDPEPPIALPELIAACHESGLDNGGWFIFANDKQWAYRSNEFADGELAAVRDRLVLQAKSLRAVLAARGLASAVCFSFERVHGIWVFD